MKTNRTNRRTLKLESLESRKVLAGNVSAVIDSGSLIITGDVDSNHVLISQGANAGEVIITGGTSDPLDALTATNINAGATAVTLSGFTGDIQIDMRGGDDRVVITDLNVSGSVSALMGAGNDTFGVQSVTSASLDFATNAATPVVYGAASVAQNVFVSGSAGDDVVAMFDATVDGDVAFYGADGDDDFLQDGSNLLDNNIGGMLYINLSTGDDSITANQLNVSHLFVTDPIGVSTGATVDLTNVHVANKAEMYLTINDDNVSIVGTDTSANAFTADSLILHTGNGNDQITVDNTNVANLTMFTGEGNEGGGFFGVSLTNLNVSDTLHVDTAGGTENILLQNIVTGRMNVNTGADSDGVIVNNVTAADAFFSTGADGDVVGMYDSDIDALAMLLLGGDDSLFMANTNTSGSASIDGGVGNNVFNDLGGLTLTGLTRISI